jgi:hypothetical protein
MLSNRHVDYLFQGPPTFWHSPFERIWLESRKRLPEYMEQKPANTGLRSQYSLRLYSWAKKYVEYGARTISLEELRWVLGLESIKNPVGNFIKEAPLPVWANFQQRAIDVAILEVIESCTVCSLSQTNSS